MSKLLEHLIQDALETPTVEQDILSQLQFVKGQELIAASCSDCGFYGAVNRIYFDKPADVCPMCKGKMVCE